MVRRVVRAGGAPPPPPLDQPLIMTCSTQTRCEMVPVRSRGIYPVYDLEMITENPRSAPVCVCPAEYLCKKSIYPGNLYVAEPGRLVIVKTNIAPTHQRRCGKVMFFSRAYLFTVGSVVTITHGVLSLIIQGPPHPPLSLGHRPSHLYRDPMDMLKLVQLVLHCTGTPRPPTCSKVFIMKHVQLVSGRLASY